MRLVRVIDGDTVEVDIDLGCGLIKRERVRMLGINAPEMRGKSRAAGEKSKEYLTRLLSPHVESLTLKTAKGRTRGKYGRFLATIWAGGIDVNQTMVRDGYAVSY